MKTNYIRLITFVALISILVLQGMWLYNTYKLLETEFHRDISHVFIRSLLREDIIRVDDLTKDEEKWKGKSIRGIHIGGDDYDNNMVFQDWLYNENYPISLERVDSIFNEEIKKSYKHLDCSFFITDSLGNQTAFFSSGSSPVEHFAYKETIKLRNIAPEYITLVISSPYEIGVLLGRMLLMQIGSFVVTVIVAYGLIMQIRIINKQDKTAKLRQDFTHSMIHDIKNPVTSIIMGAEALKSGKIEDKPQVKAHYYNIISQEGERILRLANKVLELAHFEGQKVALSKQPVNLRDLLENLKEKYSSNTAKKSVFHFDLNGAETVYADPHYIYEAFDNLIENAVKYSKENEDADITVTSSQNGNSTQITFKDLGIGISEKDQKIIFQKFERSMAVINSPNKISGFGLGLNFVQQVVQAHGGTVKVNSRLGLYSEFIINLPIVDCGSSPQ